MKTLILWLLIGLVIALCVGCSQPLLYDRFSPPSGTVLLASSFENQAAVEWSPSPDERYWVVEDGEYGLADHTPNGVPQRTFSRSSDWNGFIWEDYTVSATINFKGSVDSWLGPYDDQTSILFRVLDESCYMELVVAPIDIYANQSMCGYPFDPPAAQIRLLSHQDGVRTLLGFQEIGEYPQSSFHLRIELHGRLCLVYVDKQLVIDTSDTYPLAGGVGLQTAVYRHSAELLEPSRWREAWFDDIRVVANDW